MATNKTATKSASSKVTKGDLQARVDYLNKKMCNDTKHKLVVSGAYGGYKVQLTGKERKDGKGWRGALGSGCTDVTGGYKSAKETLNELNSKTAGGETKKQIARWESKPSKGELKRTQKSAVKKKK